MRADQSTPDTRPADNAIEINPASVTALIQLSQGGVHIARPPWSSTSLHQGGAPLHCRLRYFDPERRRAGVDSSAFDIELRPGCGARLQLSMRRYANAPTLAFPWTR